MYPEIRLIGTIQAMEEPIGGKPDRVITVSASLRGGQKGSFRVRMLSGDAAHYGIGDEILVQGELDEVGAIHPNHGGFLRKLAPAPSLPVLQATDAISIPEQSPPMSPPSRPLSTPQPIKTPQAFPRPATPQNGRPQFGSLFGAPKPSTAKPAPAANSAPPARETARATAVATGSVDNSSKAFASAQPDRRPASSPSFASANGTANRDNTPRQSWDVERPAQAATPARKTKSELAEYLQDEIPW